MAGIFGTRYLNVLSMQRIYEYMLLGGLAARRLIVDMCHMHIQTTGCWNFNTNWFSVNPRSNLDRDDTDKFVRRQKLDSSPTSILMKETVSDLLCNVQPRVVVVYFPSSSRLLYEVYFIIKSK